MHHHRRASRRDTFQLFFAIAVGALLASCEAPWDDESPPPDQRDDRDRAAPLEGTWTWKTETMTLKWDGRLYAGTTRVEGFRQDPKNPVVYPVPTEAAIAPDGRVRVEEHILYVNHPSKNYDVVKIGRLESNDRLVLEVVEGQSPHTQVWVRR
ncbi:MAG: hypothetical protein N2652_07355 [Kiritimatiellae bacterium]|nr:hypothetical protein [Kiritimatiellia bacterium]